MKRAHDFRQPPVSYDYQPLIQSLALCRQEVERLKRECGDRTPLRHQAEAVARRCSGPGHPEVWAPRRAHIVKPRHMRPGAMGGFRNPVTGSEKITICTKATTDPRNEEIFGFDPPPSLR